MTQLSNKRWHSQSKVASETSDDDALSIYSDEGQPETVTETEKPSNATMFRLKSKLRDLLPAGCKRQSELLSAVVATRPRLMKASAVRGKQRENPSSSFYRQKTHLVTFLGTVSNKWGDDTVDQLLLNWGQELSDEDYDSFTKSGLSFVNSRDIPISVQYRDQSEKVWKEVYKNLHMGPAREMAVQHCVRVYKEVFDGRGETHGDIVELSRACGVSVNFASKVVEAVRTDKVGELLVRKTRSDSVAASGLMTDLIQFLSEPENSYCRPGESVSVAR